MTDLMNWLISFLQRHWLRQSIRPLEIINHELRIIRLHIKIVWIDIVNSPTKLHLIGSYNIGLIEKHVFTWLIQKDVAFVIRN